jgi:single stranded DNA-binding protein
MNSWSFTGRLGQDPRVRTMQSGQRVLHLNVAVARRVKRGAAWIEQPVWVDVSFFVERSIDAISDRARKGTQVAVVGTLSGTRAYESKEGHRTALDVIANYVEVLNSSLGGEVGTECQRLARDSEETTNAAG